MNTDYAEVHPGIVLADSRDTRGGEATPAELARLLNSASVEGREAAWEAFVQRFSRLILHTVRRHAPGYDDAMDRYAFVLERLNEDGATRLGQFSPNGSGQFSTWLVVVVRRLCDDYHRRTYGRLRAGPGEPGARARERHEARRRLVDMIVEEDTLEFVPTTAGPDPERTLRVSELRAALERALSGLPDRDRLMLQLRYEEGMTAREVARFLRLPSQFHVYRRIKTVLADVRRHMEAQGFRDSRP